ncbi:hypothetical protein KCP75_23945 [Salmonella enterica subsp. enterica]|nr:hypothetical protein KCP75_23945 [Salmonella enterica subsp. enterica]
MFESSFAPSTKTKLYPDNVILMKTYCGYDAGGCALHLRALIPLVLGYRRQNWAMRCVRSG